jgi:quinol monooxygenase YgiN
MAIGAVFAGGGTTQAQYDQVHQAVTPGNRAPKGLLYHVAGPSQDGFCVVEVWESREAMDAFFAASLGAALAKAGIKVEPRFFEVYNTMTP